MQVQWQITITTYVLTNLNTWFAVFWQALVFSWSTALSGKITKVKDFQSATKKGTGTSSTYDFIAKFHSTSLTQAIFFYIHTFRAKICLFLGSLLMFLCIMGSVWVSIDRWFKEPFNDHPWQGIALLLNTMLIFVAAGILRAGRT